MIAAAFLLLSLGWLGVYAGFTDTDPREEIKSALNAGSHAARGSLSDVPLSPESSDAKRARQTQAQHDRTRKLAH